MLKIEDVSVDIGGMPVLGDISLEVSSGEIATIIGPNGAGKTTLVKSISGLIPIKKGSILLDEVNINNVKAFEMAKRFLPKKIDPE